MNYVNLVLALVLLQYIYFSISVGMAREKYNVKAPAISGNEMFERYLRVQMNTLELLVCFVPGILIASQYWSPMIMSVIGLVYLIGRVIYFRSYIKDPSSRTLGFAMSMLPVLSFLILIIAGVVKNGF